VEVEVEQDRTVEVEVLVDLELVLLQCQRLQDLTLLLWVQVLLRLLAMFLAIQEVIVYSQP
jgi:hypothetical protein